MSDYDNYCEKLRPRVDSIIVMVDSLIESGVF